MVFCKPEPGQRCTWLQQQRLEYRGSKESRSRGVLGWTDSPSVTKQVWDRWELRACYMYQWKRSRGLHLAGFRTPSQRDCKTLTLPIPLTCFPKIRLSSLCLVIWQALGTTGTTMSFINLGENVWSWGPVAELQKSSHWLQGTPSTAECDERSFMESWKADLHGVHLVTKRVHKTN